MRRRRQDKSARQLKSKSMRGEVDAPAYARFSRCTPMTNRRTEARAHKSQSVRSAMNFPCSAAERSDYQLVIMRGGKKAKRIANQPLIPPCHYSIAAHTPQQRHDYCGYAVRGQLSPMFLGRLNVCMWFGKTVNRGGKTHFQTPPGPGSGSCEIFGGGVCGRGRVRGAAGRAL